MRKIKEIRTGNFWKIPGDGVKGIRAILLTRMKNVDCKFFENLKIEVSIRNMREINFRNTVRSIFEKNKNRNLKKKWS